METLIEMAKRAAYFNEMELQVLLESYDEEKDIITRKGNAKKPLQPGEPKPGSGSLTA